MCIVKKVSKKFIVIFLASLLVFIALPFSSSAADDLPFDNEWSNVLICDEPSTGVQTIGEFTFISDVVLSYNDILESMLCAWNYDIEQYDIYRISEYSEMLVPIDSYVLSGYSFGDQIFFVDQPVEDVPAGIYISDSLFDSDHSTYFCFGRWENSAHDLVKGGIYQFSVTSDQGNSKIFEFELTDVFPRFDTVYVGYYYALNYLYLAFSEDSNSFYLSDSNTLIGDSSVIVYRLSMRESSDGVYRVSNVTLFDRSSDDMPGGVAYFSLHTLNYNYSDTLTVIYEPSLLGTILSWFFVGVPGLLGFAGSVFSFLTGAVILPWVLIGVVVSLISFLIYKTKGFTRL